MTNNLRDRIAAVLRDKLLDEIDGAVNGVDNIYVGDYVEESAIHLTALADAVIEELSLKPQSEVYKYGPIMPDGFQQALLRHRYVTEWMSLTDDTTGDVNHD